MRAFLVGIVLVAICGSSAAGQATGFVEQIGFQKQYRPHGWTPVLVNLTSQISEPAEYQIQVRQEDLDRDRVIFRRDIVLNPNKQEKFWVYFMAQPSGLPYTSPAELSKTLDVRLCTKGGKPLVHLKIQDPLQNLDPGNQGYNPRGTKLILAVTDGNSAPAMSAFRGTIGMSEDVAMALVSPFDLPENVIGYDAVDGIVWLDADASKMTTGGSRRLAAMTEYVRSGGRLVICQPAELFKIEGLADLMPVEMKDAAGNWQIDLRDRDDLRPLRDLARYKVEEPPVVTNGDTKVMSDLARRHRAGWDRLEQRGPFKVAFARPKPSAVGEEWIDWAGDKSQMSPWLVRQPLGMGSVTWVAQDLGNPVLAGRDATGWPYVWDRILGYRNTDMRVAEEWDGKERFQDELARAYASNGAIDIGGSILAGMEHTGRAGGLVFLAGVFFVGYWLVAGPVSYLVLAGKKRTELSWTLFAVSALVATLLTVGVVRLVLRGDAEVHHVSLVRMLPAGKADDGSPVSRAVVDSRVGLYIPRDGAQVVTLLENDPQALSYLTPFSIHPRHQTNTTDFPAYLEYEIPVRDNPLTTPVQVAVPYRSTLKKLQARWVGPRGGGIEVPAPPDGNKPRLVPSEKKREAVDETGAKRLLRHGYINGAVANRTGTDLAHVWFVFHHPDSVFGGVVGLDQVLYVPHWADGTTIDLGRQYNGAEQFQPPGTSSGAIVPGGNHKRSIRGHLGGELGWERYWYNNLRGSGMGDTFEDTRGEFLRAFPLLCLYDRLAPQKNDVDRGAERAEILRRAARDWDCSDLVAAGQLVILARAGKPGVTSDESPLPFPMEVGGERVSGTGTTFYQFALPLDRSELGPAWEAGLDPEDEPEGTRPPGVGPPPDGEAPGGNEQAEGGAPPDVER
jgi:hypothetical protein